MRVTLMAVALAFAMGCGAEDSGGGGGGGYRCNIITGTYQECRMEPGPLPGTVVTICETCMNMRVCAEEDRVGSSSCVTAGRTYACHDTLETGCE